MSEVPRLELVAVDAQDPLVGALLRSLTAELAQGGYTPSQTFGYSPDQRERANVHLVGAHMGDRLVGVGGVELQEGHLAELKRVFVVQECRGVGVADAIIRVLLNHAVAHGVTDLRLETGDRQQAAIAFYRRHGLVEVPCWGPYADGATSVCMQRRLAS